MPAPPWPPGRRRPAPRGPRPPCTRARLSTRVGPSAVPGHRAALGAAASSSWASSANRGWTRLTTRAVTAMSDSASLPAKWTASSTESGRGEATSTKAVSGLDQELAHPGRPGPEPLLHALEGLEEGDGVVDDVGPGHLGDGAQQGLGGHAHELESRPGRLHQGLEQAVLQEVGQAPRGVEEVEGVAGRRGVHHHQVEAALLDQLVELLHGHVLLGARQRAGQVPVDPVDLDVLGLFGGVRVPVDQVVEGPLGVEHEGVELAGPGALDPGRAGW